jgi:hypothetical protein
MPLPEHLERLKDIPIDTLGLSDSTSALLKWNGITHVLDCIAFFYGIAQERWAANPWPRFVRLLFGEVRPALIAAGYWDLVMDAQAWCAIEQSYEPPYRRVVHWQGRDQDLYEIEMPLEPLALSEMPPEFAQRFANIGDCIDEILALLRGNSEFWLEIEAYEDFDRATQPPRQFNEFVFGVVQPCLVEQGYWRFVEAHVDDFDMAEGEWDDEEDDGDWEDDEESADEET